MSEKASFYGPGQPDGSAQPEGSAQPDIGGIEISDVPGPLLILYGPPEIGKTVALLRLCTHIASQYSIEVNTEFRADPRYVDAVKAFELQRKQKVLAPEGTAPINFLLADITQRGALYCQVLEAPGEHYFPRNADEDFVHPRYLNAVFQGSARKIYLLFFERKQMARGDLEAYASSIRNTLRRNADARRDRVIIVYNKADERSDLFRNGRPLVSEFRRELQNHKGFGPLREFLKEQRFRRVHFVPFSSGTFAVNQDGIKTYAISAEHYPRKLWSAISDCVTGRRFPFLW